MEGNAIIRTNNSIKPSIHSLDKFPNAGFFEKKHSKVEHIKKSELSHSPSDILNDKKILTSNETKPLSEGLQEFENILKEQKITSEDIEKCEELFKEEQVTRKEKTKSDIIESDEFEQMLLNEGIISMSEYKQTIKLLQPNEQEFDRMIKETCQDYPERNKNHESQVESSENVVILNKKKQNLSPTEIKDLEAIIKAHAIERDDIKNEKGDSENKPETMKRRITTKREKLENVSENDPTKPKEYIKVKEVRSKILVKNTSVPETELREPKKITKSIITTIKKRHDFEEAPDPHNTKQTKTILSKFIDVNNSNEEDSGTKPEKTENPDAIVYFSQEAHNRASSERQFNYSVAEQTNEAAPELEGKSEIENSTSKLYQTSHLGKSSDAKNEDYVEAAQALVEKLFLSEENKSKTHSDDIDCHDAKGTLKSNPKNILKDPIQDEEAKHPCPLYTTEDIKSPKSSGLEVEVEFDSKNKKREILLIKKDIGSSTGPEKMVSSEKKTELPTEKQLTKDILEAEFSKLKLEEHADEIKPSTKLLQKYSKLFEDISSNEEQVSKGALPKTIKEVSLTRTKEYETNDKSKSKDSSHVTTVVNETFLPGVRKVTTCTTQYEKVTTTTKEVEYVQGDDDNTIRTVRIHSPKIKETYIITEPHQDVFETSTGRGTKYRKKPKPNFLFMDPGLVHTEECDEYCNYIKKIEEDSSELENHLRALKLVDSKSEKYLNETFDVKTLKRSSAHKINSSIDDFIRKLNQFDVDSWVKGNLGHKSKNVDVDHSRSLDDLSFRRMVKGNENFEITAKKSKPVGILKKPRNSDKSESFSRSVLDLTTVGLPKFPVSEIPYIEEEEEYDNVIKPQINLSIRTVEPGRGEIQIRNIGHRTTPHLNPLEQHFFDRRCSDQVFGQRADASPYLDDRSHAHKPKTQSLHSLDQEKRLTIHQNYEKLQSMDCLLGTREVFSDPECSSQISHCESEFQLSSHHLRNKGQHLSKSTSSPSALSINRLYVHTPFNRHLKDLAQPKMPKSILKKTSNFQPRFESISMTSLPQQEYQKSNTGVPYPYMSTVEKSKSCGNMPASQVTCRGTKPLTMASNPQKWRTYMVTASTTSASSNSASDSQFDSDSSRVSSYTNPPATIIRYVTPKQCSESQKLKPYVDYYDWSQQNVSEDDVNLSEIESLNVLSDDSEFGDRGFGYFYKGNSERKKKF